MEKITTLSPFITSFFRGIPIIFRDKHKLMFMWLLIMQAARFGNFTLTDMARYAPSHVSEWRWRRLLTAGYWSAKAIFYWLVDEVLKKIPHPEDGVVYLIVDGSKKDKRGKKNPFGQKGKIRSNKSWFFGIKFIVLMLSWKGYRIPIDFEIIRPKKHKGYKNENALFRIMLNRFEPASWMKEVIILGDAGFASKENMNLIKQKNALSKKLFWGFVFSLSKTWKKEDDSSIKTMVKHLKHSCYTRKTLLPISEGRKRSFWVFAKQVSLRHVGDVTIVLSKKRRNAGPKSVKIMVTNMLHLTDKEIISIYQRRFLIEVLFRELKSGLGLGSQQVTGNETRISNSIAMGMMSYLFLLRMQHDDIVEGKSWSIFNLQMRFKNRLIIEQVKHECNLEMISWKKAA